MSNNYNFVSNMQCNIADVINTILQEHPEVWDEPKDNDGTSITVGDCLDDLRHDIDELYAHFNCKEEELQSELDDKALLESHLNKKAGIYEEEPSY